MARATAAAAAARRGKVAELELRGVSAHGIARALGSDPRTIKRDLRALAAERARDTSLTAERHRLLAAAKLVEQQAWQLHHALSVADAAGKLGALGKVLGAQEAGRRIVGDLAMAALEERVAALEQQVAAAGGQKGATRP